MLRIVIMYLDYTGIPRAWASAPTNKRAEAERVAKAHLEAYCKKKQELGEPDLADPKKYTLKAEIYAGDPS